MNNSSPLQKIIKKQNTQEKALWLMRQAGRYLPEYKKVRAHFPNFLSFCYHADASAEVTLQPIERFGFDAAIIFSDILVIPDAMGIDVGFTAGEGPKLAVVEEGDSFAAQLDVEKLAPVYEAIKKVRQTLAADKSLFGFAGSPWTLATYMIEGRSGHKFQESLRWCYGASERLDVLVDVLSDHVITHLSHQIEAGCDIVQLFDSWSGVLAPEAFARFVIKPAKKITEALKQRYPEIPIIGFPKGSGFNMLNYAKEAGVDVLAVDQYTDMAMLRDNVSLPTQGNIDPYLLAEDKKGVIKAAKQLMQATKDRPHIFNLGHGILPHTPIDNVHALVDTIRSN